MIQFINNYNNKMLKGEWDLNISYKRGDIVFKKSNLDLNVDNKYINNTTYYICCIPHISDNLINPRNIEEIYWLEIRNMLPSILTINNSNENNKSNEDNKSNETKESNDINKSTDNNDNKYDNNEDKESNDINKSIDNETNEDKSTIKLLNIEDSKLKRKLKNVEHDILKYKKKSKLNDNKLHLKDQIMLLDVDIETKIFLLDKYENIKNTSNSDYAKGKAWLKCVLNIPFGKYKPFKIKFSDNENKINRYFKMVRGHLDKNIHDMDKVKDEIMEFLARKISNPNSKGHVLALCGKAGVGKTKILKSLAEALELPFHQINCGGLNDASILVGHSETYVGSKPGKLVEIISNSGCMNPIIYLDEIDKISQNKGKEINGILTHLLDEEQNNKFQDHYLSNINIDLSKALFVIAFNDIEKVDRIVSDRMKVIYIDSPSIESKLTIAAYKMIPDIINSFNIKKDKFINLDKDLLRYILEDKVPHEDGVRQFRKTLEKLFNKLNYLLLTGTYKNSSLSITTVSKKRNKDSEVINITKSFIDECLSPQCQNKDYLNMYI
jgi:ATP-dependent Lon protease